MSLIIALTRCRWWWLWLIPTILAVLLAVHPVWMITVARGDCGIGMIEASWWWTERRFQKVQLATFRM